MQEEDEEMLSAIDLCVIYTVFADAFDRCELLALLLLQNFPTLFSVDKMDTHL
jgi:hypothetical protein